MGAHGQRAAVYRWLHPWGLTEEWIAFLAQMDDLYERLARARGEPYVRHTAEELRVIAALAAGFGLRPEEAAAQAGGTDERELTLGGVG
jgi:hypothetical protein